MGALKPTGERIGFHVSEPYLWLCFLWFSLEMQVVFVVDAVRDPVGAFGWF